MTRLRDRPMGDIVMLLFASAIVTMVIGIGGTMTVVLVLHAGEPDIAKITAPLFSLLKTIMGGLLGYVAGRATGLAERGRGRHADDPDP